jgi:hypothetical protein
MNTTTPAKNAIPNPAMTNLHHAERQTVFNRGVIVRKSLFLLVWLLSPLAAVCQDITSPVPTTMNVPIPTISSTEPVELNAHETVSLATGAVSFSLPVVSLPQRGGKTLDIGFVLSGNNYSLKETHA